MYLFRAELRGRRWAQEYKVDKKEAGVVFTEFGRLVRDADWIKTTNSVGADVASLYHVWGPPSNRAPSAGV